MRHRRVAAFTLAVLAALSVSCTAAKPKPTRASPPREAAPSYVPATPDSANGNAKGLNKLDHLIFIVMENRSFDHYFGTYPGADGLPVRSDGSWDVCVPHPQLNNRCMTPYHDTDWIDDGAAHSNEASVIDVNGGKMNGFIRAAVSRPKWANPVCVVTPKDPGCANALGPQLQPDVMGYHNRHEIPNYWAYADFYVLQDRFFAPTDSWTLPSHLFLISGWSANCSDDREPMSCHSAIGSGGVRVEQRSTANPTPYAWTDITWLLHQGGVDWRYYVGDGTCIEHVCPLNPKTSTQFQNPLPGFRTVVQNEQMDHIVYNEQYFRAADEGTLPPVSWIVPALPESDHPHRGSIQDGQAWVTDVVNAAMNGPDWDSTAIFLSWDDWGGFYDHVVPPKIDENGYGIRVPGLVISPYAKKGYIDHQTLTYDAYLKLIEDRFLGGQRLDPATDGRPDPRPTVRETVPQLGDITRAFDFNQKPRPPMVLDPYPAARVTEGT